MKKRDRENLAKEYLPADEVKGKIWCWHLTCVGCPNHVKAKDCEKYIGTGKPTRFCLGARVEK